MVEILEQLGLFIENVIRTLGYPGIAFLMFLENVFPPTPGEVVMPFSGFLVGRGEFTFFGAWLAAVIGATSGSLMLYYIGVWADERLVRRFLRNYGRYLTVTEKELDQAMTVFNKYGDIIVFTARFLPLPYVRTLVSVVAGMNRMKPWKFIVFTAIGSGIWSGIWLTAGVILGENWQAMLNTVGQNEQLSILLGIVILALIAAIYVIRLRKMRAQERMAEQPITE
jgi:membrane protein DedA with SNARE-associated domain